MPTIQYSESPNVETAFVVQDGGQKNRVVLTAPQDTSTLELPANPNSTKGYVTDGDGKKHRVVLTADIGGGSGGSGVTSVNGKTGDVVLDASDVGAVSQTVATISLASTDWSSHTQTVTVTGVTADNTVIVAPAPASAADYATAEILCTAQAANSLTFTCTTDPTNNISVNVLILN